MPQYAFMQVMAVAATLAIVGVVVAIPVGKRAGARVGRLVLRGCLLALLLTVAGCLVWGQATGDLGRFTARMGADAWLQIAVFFGLILSTGYRFSGRYLDDLAAGEQEEVSHA